MLQKRKNRERLHEHLHFRITVDMKRKLRELDKTYDVNDWLRTVLTRELEKKLRELQAGNLSY